MLKRTGNTIGVTILLVWVCLGSVCLASHRSGRPNIIFLLTDDQRDNTFGIMGHDWVSTPHIDQLIKQGVRFSNAYIAEPTCSPSRISLFTGMHERVNGVGFTSSYQLNETQWEESYPSLLRKGGYTTGFIGKFGVEYYTFKGRAAETFDFWRGHEGWARFFQKTAKNCVAYYDSDEEIITPVMGESVTRFLRTAPRDKPFCLSVSFSIPHGSQTGSMYVWQSPASDHPKLKDHPVYGNLYRDLDIQIPHDTATDPYQYIPKRIMDQDQGRRNRTYFYDYDREICREHHIRYYQQITGLDHVVGNMVTTLKKQGLDKDTVILFASDHGLLMGEYGMGGKGLLYDLTAKFPCFVYDPRLPKTERGKTVEDLVSSLDLTSTILDYAGIPQPKGMQGCSLVPLVRGEKIPWRDMLFLENLYTGRDTPFSEGIRKGHWKYIRMFDGVAPYTEAHTHFAERTPAFEHLFDLAKDPAEKTNLIAAYEGTVMLKALRSMCQAQSFDLNTRRSEYRKTHQVTER
ncbi:MAG: sulfatase-like hydrolase/transferase [Planctomycetes bacterium]|nr:sulfatase-like hydrolase/transferase [Planctomycetota bacterium]